MYSEVHRIYDGELLTSQGLRAMFAAAVSPGVIAGRAEELSVFGDSTGMQVKVRTGEAWAGWTGAVADPQVVHYLMTKSAGDPYKALAIAGNGSGNPRIDRVVLRADANAKTVSTVVIQGTPAASPAAPAVVRSGGIYDVRLAQVYVANGALTIAASNVTDERDWSQPAAGVLLDATDLKRNVSPILGPSRSLHSRWYPVDGRVLDTAFTTTSLTYVTAFSARVYTSPVQYTLRVRVRAVLRAAGGATATLRLRESTTGTVLQEDASTATTSTTDVVVYLAGTMAVVPNTEYTLRLELKTSDAAQVAQLTASDSFLQLT